MLIFLTTLLATLWSIFRSRASLGLENLALRHQIGVLHRSAGKRPKLTAGDRLLWICLSRLWRDWRSALAIVKPETVVAWHRAAFRLFWTWKVRCGKPGRPVISSEVRDLIRKMCRENPGWGAPRSPWQRAYIERVIGSVRRECLDHMIVFHETSLRRTLTSYFDYYHRSRTHLSLGKDAPEPRAIHPPAMGSVVALPLVGGLHHRYERRAA